jgi:hypothetical protein
LDMNITFKLIWGRRLVWNIEDYDPHGRHTTTRCLS